MTLTSIKPHPAQVIIPLLEHDRPAVRKKAILTLGECGSDVFISQQLFISLKYSSILA